MNFHFLFPSFPLPHNFIPGFLPHWKEFHALRFSQNNSLPPFLQTTEVFESAHLGVLLSPQVFKASFLSTRKKTVSTHGIL